MEMDNQPQQPQQPQQPSPQTGPNPGPYPGSTPQQDQGTMNNPASGPSPMGPQPPQPMGPGGQPYQQPQQQKTDTLGIVSLIMIIIFPLLGAILGFVGMSKAKKEGYSGTLSKVGAIVNTILVVLGAVVVGLLVVATMNTSDELQNDFSQDFDFTNTSEESGPYEVSFVSELGNICEGNGWPTNLTASASGNVVGVFSNSATFPDSYSTEYLSLDGELEDVESSTPSTVDTIVCVSSVGQEPIRVVQCDLEINDEEVKAPMSLRPYKATVYNAANQTEIGTFTAQPEDRCPFFVTVNPDDNSFDAGLDEESFNTELAKLL